MRRLSLSLVPLLLGFSLARAQEITTGSVGGQVTDTQGAPIPSASVTLTSAQGSKTFATDTSGRFFVPYLTPGRYTLKVQLSGFVPIARKDIDVRVGQRLQVAGLTLAPGGQETIDVVAAAPVVDTSSATVGGILEADAMQRLPVGRNFSDALYLLPGVSSSGGVGRSDPSVSGASGLENHYVIDGVNVTNVGYGYVGEPVSDFGIGVTTDFIQETQVKTAGFEAEYGQARAAS